MLLIYGMCVGGCDGGGGGGGGGCDGGGQASLVFDAFDRTPPPGAKPAKKKGGFFAQMKDDTGAMGGANDKISIGHIPRRLELDDPEGKEMRCVWN